MKSRQELLEDFSDDLEDLQQEVDDEIQRLKEGEEISQDFILIRSFLNELDDRRERQAFIQNLNPGNRTFVPPVSEELQQWKVDSDSSEERMGELRRSLFRVWNEATSSYIHGLFYAAVVTMAAALEGVLKHELEREDIEYDDWGANLKECISRARDGGVLPHNGEVSDAADRVRKIRNGVVHFNPERNLGNEEFSTRRALNRRRQAEGVDYPGAEVVEMWGEAARIVIEDAYLIIEFIYEDQLPLY